jgi:hypothetical protein
VKVTTVETAAKMTSAAMASATVTAKGKSGSAGCSQQQSRGADVTEAINAQQGYRRQTAGQEFAAGGFILGHRDLRFRDCSSAVSKAVGCSIKAVGLSQAFGQITSASSSQRSKQNVGGCFSGRVQTGLTLQAIIETET